MLRTNILKRVKLSNNKLFKFQSFNITYEKTIANYEADYVKNFIASQQNFSCRELGEVSRILAKNRITDEQIWQAFEQCAERHSAILDAIDLRKVCSALVSNERVNQALYEKLTKRQKEIGMEMSGAKEQDFDQAKKTFNSAKQRKVLPRPMRVFLWGYNLRWRVTKYLERFGLFFK